jgi:hypothetical protein
MGQNFVSQGDGFEKKGRRPVPLSAALDQSDWLPDTRRALFDWGAICRHHPLIGLVDQVP